uniref:Proteasome subunit alpha type n=1 Tax=Heterorhabditis bacteriophora TaxID=37862 RepID=A0A1I7W656_HETBA
MGDHYGFSLTTFSPSGKLMQIEYALNAVKNGQPSVGLRVILLCDDKCAHTNVILFSGMGPDFRILVKRARKIAMEYELMYGEEISTTQLVSDMAAVMQEYTQSGGVRPFGVSLLIAGWDKNPSRPLLFQSDPSVSFPWILKKIFCLQFVIFLYLTSFTCHWNNYSGTICDASGFHRLTKQQVKDHLGAL